MSAIRIPSSSTIRASSQVRNDGLSGQIHHAPRVLLRCASLVAGRRFLSP
jgi:hypothetical protein